MVGFCGAWATHNASVCRLLTALVAGAADPIALAARLQLPLKQQRVLQQQQCLLAWLAELSGLSRCRRGRRQIGHKLLSVRTLCLKPWPTLFVYWLSQAADGAFWKPLLRWWGRWRHLQAAVTAKDLMARGWKPGPALGEELRRLRWQRLEQLR